MANLNRVNKGVPQGGEFANKRTNESDVELDVNEFDYDDKVGLVMTCSDCGNEFTINPDGSSNHIGDDGYVDTNLDSDHEPYEIDSFEEDFDNEVKGDMWLAEIDAIISNAREELSRSSNPVATMEVTEVTEQDVEEWPEFSQFLRDHTEYYNEYDRYTKRVLIDTMHPNAPTSHFVYGTLREGQGNDVLWDEMATNEDATVVGVELYGANSPFPYAIASNNPDSVVKGERVTWNNNLDRLSGMVKFDTLEGYPRYYDRKIIEANLADGSTDRCWIYIPTPYLEEIVLKNEEKITSGDWKER